MLQSDLVVGVKHLKLELDIVSNKGNPLSSFLFVNVNEILDIYLSLVIFWVVAVLLIPNFVVSYIVDANDSSLSEIPLGHLRAQDVIR